MLKRYLFLIFSFIISSTLFSQVGSIKGNLYDSTSKTNLQYAVIVLTKAKDSSLVKYTRSNDKGFFELNQLPLDTYKLMITHPQFSELNRYVLITNKKADFNLENLILPPKSYQIREIVVYADKEPIFYRGDTLVYRADSFKVKDNANVEDLLKKLPGMKVDAQGKITVQGQTVDQVLVDGDEFFGDDPTMATQNLSAKSINTLEVYDKKDNSSESTETTKVLNLTLKEDAKKGYFGKVEGGSDFNRFYEGTVLGNKFKGKRKMSIYGLGSNTPKSGFDWQDLNSFGLGGDWSEGDDGNWTNSGGDLSSWGGNKNGIPRNFKSGLNYNDKWGEKVKVYANYNYKNGLMNGLGEEFTQYFLQGDTGYNTSNKSISRTINNSHNANFSVSIDLDSLSSLKISPNFKWASTSAESRSFTDYLSKQNELSRTNTVGNNRNGESMGANGKISFDRKFKKKNRVFEADLNLDYSKASNEEFLFSQNKYSSSSSVSPISDIDQKKVGNGNAFSQKLDLVWMEPITSKFKIRGTYTFSNNNSNNIKSTYNRINNEYSGFDSLYSNNFENLKYFNEPGIDFIYETKKYTISAGSKYRNSLISSVNKVNGKSFSQNINNLFPTFKANYNFSKSTRLSFNYRGSTKQPDINQLQPLPDNSNPNSVKTGNPDLKPSFSQSLRLNFNSYKGLSGSGFNSNASYTTTNNQFINNTTFDSSGRTITKPVNVNGAYNINGNISTYFKVKKLSLDFNIGLSTSYSNQISLINSKKNLTKNFSLGPNAGISYELEEKFDISLNAEFDYNVPKSSINQSSNSPYTTQNYTVSSNIKLPKKFQIGTDAEYTLNGKRANGYNVNYIIWNANIEKKFLKTENLILGIRAYDLLNQNVSLSRNVSDNRITDTKNNIVKRYILGVITFKFNNTGGKADTDDDDY
jgi:outer membrane receptor protein involved in Fe transport